MHRHNHLRQLVDQIGSQLITIESLSPESDCPDCRAAGDPKSLSDLPSVAFSLICRVIAQAAGEDEPGRKQLLILQAIEMIDLDLQDLLVSNEQSCRVVAEALLTLTEINHANRGQVSFDLEDLRSLAIINLEIRSGDDAAAWMDWWQNHKLNLYRQATRESGAAKPRQGRWRRFLPISRHKTDNLVNLID